MPDQFSFLFSTQQGDKIAEFYGCLFCGCAIGETAHGTVFRDQHRKRCTFEVFRLEEQARS